MADWHDDIAQFDQTTVDLTAVQVLFHHRPGDRASSTLDVISLGTWSSDEGLSFPAGSPMTWSFHHDVLGGEAVELLETFDRWAARGEVVSMGSVVIDGVHWIVMIGDDDRVAMEVAPAGG
ncbi:MAG TPA: hypothetical protein VJM33_09785 [Microthrixaceae bacterium]|nr:hypothetical protein [Microthrixaceae bacterium]